MHECICSLLCEFCCLLSPSLPLSPLMLKYMVSLYFHSMLADRNLPAAIEETSGQGLPDSIREKAEGVQAGGGVASIDQKIGNLPDMVTNNKEILGEVEPCMCGEVGVRIHFNPFLPFRRNVCWRRRKGKMVH